MTSRPFDDRVTLLAVFADRVAALSPEAWASIRARCAPLAGSAPMTVFARAQLSAAPYDVGVPNAPEVPMVSIFRGFLQGAITSMSFVKEIAFAVAPSLDEPSQPLHRTTGKPTTDRYIDATHRIRQAVQAQGPYELGISTVFDAATQALLKRDFLTDAQFREIYRWIELEIPIASIDDQPVASST